MTIRTKFAFGLLLLAGPLWGQSVTVSGTVRDASGAVYVGGSGRAVLISGNGSGQQQWLTGGTNPVRTPLVINQLDSFGKFSMSVTNTSAIQPGTALPQWQYQFCSAPPPACSPQVCFTVPALSLTSSQDISAQIQTAAAPLGNNCGGGGGGGQNATYQHNGSTVAQQPKLDFEDGGATFTVTNDTDNNRVQIQSTGGGACGTGTSPFLTIWTGASTCGTSTEQDLNNTFQSGATQGLSAVQGVFTGGSVPPSVIDPSIPNDGSTGTTRFLLAKVVSNTAITAATTDTAIALFAVADTILSNGSSICGPGTTGTACLVVSGRAILTPDSGGVAANHYVGASTVTAGDIADLGAGPLNGHVFCIGKADVGAISASSTGTIDIGNCGAAGTAALPSGTGVVRVDSGVASAAELSGAVSTSGSNATTLATSYRTRACEIVWGGSGAAFALSSGDDAIANQSCMNKLGVTETITAVYCRSDAGSNTTTVNPTFGTSGTGTTILSGALTCGSSGAYSATGTVSHGALTDGSNINPVMGGTLTGTSIHLLIVYTLP